MIERSKQPLPIIIAALLLLILSACTQPDPATQQLNRFIQEQTEKKAIDKTAVRWKENLPQPPQVAFSDQHDYFWQLKTNQGEITIQLRPDIAPMHVSSTMYLTMLGFYDGLTFHRVIPGFMAQGGDPTGTGAGNPGYRYAGEFHPHINHDRAGLLSMANAGPNTDGSQFFITFVPTPHLDNRHTIFGEVVDSLQTLRQIESLGTRLGKPKSEILIEEATISVKPKS